MKLCFVEKLFYNTQFSTDVSLVGGLQQYGCFWVPKSSIDKESIQLVCMCETWAYSPNAHPVTFSGTCTYSPLIVDKTGAVC